MEQQFKHDVFLSFANEDIEFVTPIKEKLKNKGIIVDLDGLIKEVEARDQRDSSRKASPLMPAGDAVILDNSDQDEARTLQQVLQAVHGVV